MEEAMEIFFKEKSIGGNLKICGSCERGGGEGNKSLSNK
jgi:hypothetical protein